VQASEAAPASEAVPAPEAAPTSEAAPAALSPDDAGRVTRAQFSTAIEDREPTDSLETLANDVDRVFFFTELVDLTGRTVTHRWEMDGVPMAEVEFQVGGPRWRIYSSKNLEPTWLGAWTVTIVDDSGRVLASETLRYTAALEEPEAGGGDSVPPAAPDVVPE
jgi:hypothetical protein